MKQDAIIAYCRSIDTDPPTIDLYQVRNPTGWGLYDALDNVEISTSSYTLPDLSSVDCDNDTNTPTLLGENIPITEFGDLINYVTVDTVYLLHPQGRYTFKAYAMNIRHCEAAEYAVDIDVWNPDKTIGEDPPDFRLDGKNLENLVTPDTLEYITMKFYHKRIYLEGVRAAQQNTVPYDGNMRVFTPDYPEVMDHVPSVAIRWSNPEWFSKLDNDGILIAIDYPDGPDEPVDENELDWTAYIWGCRTYAAGLLNMFLNPEKDEWQPNEDIAPDGLTELEAKRYTCESLILDKAYDDNSGRLSPLSAGVYGTIITNRFNFPPTDIIAGNSSTTADLP